MGSKTVFRKDINGLRALAVLSILIFHIDHKLSGGFIGVDIFFVISGFLITGSIWNHCKKNVFSFYEFYLKRIRRLFPALFVMLLVCLVFFLIFGLASEVQQFGKAALASLFYLSNMFFYFEVDYFAADAQLNPLLHTWSLSVEEQFYLIFPITLLIIYRYRNHALLFLLSLLLISFLLSEFLLSVDPSAAFYFSPSRFWQFIVGALLAIYGGKYEFSHRRSELISFSGLLLLILTILFYHEDLPFPGALAIPPTLGTAMVILGCNGKTLTDRALGLSIPQFLGNISYSLYLWHWPVIVFYKLTINPDLEKTDKFILFFVSLFMGYLSWRFTEQPFKAMSVIKGKNSILMKSGLITLPLIAIFSVAIWNPSSLINKKSNFEGFIDYKMNARIGKCFLTSGNHDLEYDANVDCIKVGEGKNVLLLGDSHAAHYYSSLVQYFNTSNISQLNASGCRPLVNYTGKEYCTNLMRRAFEEYLNEYDFDIVVLSGRWNSFDLSGLTKTIEYLQSKNIEVIVFGPVVEYIQPLPNLLSRFENDNTLANRASIYTNRSIINSKLKEVCTRYDVQYASPIEVMCPNQTEESCLTTLENGEPIQFDNGHLTHNGALFIMSNMFSIDWQLKP